MSIFQQVHMTHKHTKQLPTIQTKARTHTTHTHTQETKTFDTAQ